MFEKEKETKMNLLYSKTISFNLMQATKKAIFIIYDNLYKILIKLSGFGFEILPDECENTLGIRGKFLIK